MWTTFVEKGFLSSLSSDFPVGLQMISSISGTVFKVCLDSTLPKESLLIDSSHRWLDSEVISLAAKVEFGTFSMTLDSASALYGIDCMFCMAYDGISR